MWASPPTDVPENFQKNCRGGRPCPPKGSYEFAEVLRVSEAYFAGRAESPTPTQCGRLSGQRRLPHVVLKHAQRPQAKPAAFSELRGFFLRGGGHKRVQLRFRAGGVGIKCFAGDSTRALCPGGGLRVVTGIGNVQVAFRICRRALCHAVGVVRYTINVDNLTAACARVQGASGENVFASTPETIPFSAAQRTAS